VEVDTESKAAVPKKLLLCPLLDAATILTTAQLTLNDHSSVTVDEFVEHALAISRPQSTPAPTWTKMTDQNPSHLKKLRPNRTGKALDQNHIIESKLTRKLNVDFTFWLLMIRIKVLCLSIKKWSHLIPVLVCQSTSLQTQEPKKLPLLIPKGPHRQHQLRILALITGGFLKGLSLSHSCKGCFIRFLSLLSPSARLPPGAWSYTNPPCPNPPKTR